jgi:hypothetical protein
VINKSFNKLPYALSWYLDIVSPKWDALILDDYIEVMPLAHRNKFGIFYIFQPLLCQQLGVFSTVREGLFCIDDFFLAIPRKFKLIDMTINSMNFVSGQIKNIRIETRTNQELKLDVSYEEIRKNYTKSHIHNIKKFDKNTVLKVDTSLTFPEFYRIKYETIKNKGIKVLAKNSQVYFRLLKELDDNGKLKIFVVVTENGEIPGGICYMHLDFGRVSIQTFCVDCCKKSGFVFNFIDQFIQKNSNKKIIFDFMGSSISGIRDFNIGFGSRDVNYYYVRLNRLSIIGKYLKK